MAQAIIYKFIEMVENYNNNSKSNIIHLKNPMNRKRQDNYLEKPRLQQTIAKTEFFSNKSSILFAYIRNKTLIKVYYPPSERCIIILSSHDYII